MTTIKVAYHVKIVLVFENIGQSLENRLMRPKLSRRWYSKLDEYEKRYVQLMLTILHDEGTWHERLVATQA